MVMMKMVIVGDGAVGKVCHPRGVECFEMTDRVDTSATHPPLCVLDEL